MVRKFGLTQKLTFGAMILALTVLALYCASVLPAGKLVFYFLSSVFIYALVCERAYMTAVICYIAASALSFLIIPEKTAFFAYVLILGHYGIFKTFIESRINDRILMFLSKLLYANIFVCAGIYIALYTLNLKIGGLISSMPLWLLIAAAEAALMIYDGLYTVSQRIYQAKIRDFMLSGR
ncbi:MAG: hypothetical protein BWY11_00513 [Firmicutes bacterium ADurb.Bin182]|nr:MAG: hypothetical protein BWY11_00513 [Firmicutes bacterium ADurb.Bin182]